MIKKLEEVGDERFHQHITPQRKKDQAASTMADTNSGDSFTMFSPRPRKSLATSSVSVLTEPIKADDIPEWMLEEILLRLPLKSIFRFKCVSKQWLVRFSEPSFINWFVSHRTRSPLPWTLLYSYTRARPDIPTDTEFTGRVSCVPRFSVLPVPPELGNLQILGSSNGLLLCCPQHWKDMYYIYNPLTKQCLALPKFGSWDNPTREGIITRVQGSVVESYKVVRVGQNPESPSRLSIDVFSSESGSWMNFDISSPCNWKFPNPFPYFQLARPVTLNETIYIADYQEGVIVAYNPYKNPDRLDFIKLPKKETKRLPPWFELIDTSGGSLRHYVVSEAWENDPILKVWEIRDPEDSGPEWSLIHSCRWREIQSEDESHRSFLPLSFDPSDRNTIYLWNAKFLGTYDMKTRRLEVLCELDSSIRGLSWESTMPYVLPTWPIPIPPPT